ncbi:SDR family oxidoreductase [Pigmentiphaga sp.]|uniref:SDR family NAD(P)-dependent oxidoreductase n=1 Tax=Pigmentiphaga sp. TaxID=1977564 RepID=UPI0025E57696|nr:SDR family oxidoreductase [Pigmentiphaga sp.]
MDRLKGKVAIVTGAAQGIGAVYARGLAAEGAAVAVCDVLDATDVASTIVKEGGRAIAGKVDVTDGDSVAGFVRQVIAELGPVDVLVNNAAIFGGLTKKPFHEIAAEEWDRVMTVNTRGVLEFSRAVVPGMKARGQGRIVNIASATIYSGTPLLLHYVASKGAVLAMTRSMARELGDFGIGVNAIAPGITMSESVRHDYADAQQLLASQMQRRCFKREQLPEDLVGPLVFLASDDSAFISGQTYIVDGGSTLQ